MSRAATTSLGELGQHLLHIGRNSHTCSTKYRAYPMYDLACPIIDHIDGVTHALRANEYYARHEQYQWFLQKLGMPKIEIFDFSRIDFVYTVLSKRKLKYLVENGVVSGWDDPRFPTVRGGFGRSWGGVRSIAQADVQVSARAA